MLLRTLVRSAGVAAGVFAVALSITVAPSSAATVKVTYEVDALGMNLEPTGRTPEVVIEGRKLREVTYVLRHGKVREGRVSNPPAPIRPRGAAPLPGDSDHADEHTWMVPASPDPAAKTWHGAIPFAVVGSAVKQIDVTVHELRVAPGPTARRIMAVGWISRDVSPAVWFQRDWWIDKIGVCTQIETRIVNGDKTSRGLTVTTEREVRRLQRR